METNKFDINGLRVASPCSVGWETMTGDERSRHCELCSLNVYNLADMTKSEVENLIQDREGRLCIRMFRRADGTVMTKDCPVGLRGAYTRTARFAGASLAAILGLFGASFAQKDDKKAVDASEIKIQRIVAASDQSELTGRITDQNGAVIPDVLVVLSNRAGKQRQTTSDSAGIYSFQNVSPDNGYQLDISTTNFERKIIRNLDVHMKESATVNIELKVDGTLVTVGIFIEEPPIIDMSSPSVTTTITLRRMESIPHRK